MEKELLWHSIQHDVTLLKIEVIEMIFSVNVRTQKVLRSLTDTVWD